MTWLILAILGAATYLYGVSTHAIMLCLLTKPVPVLALLGWLHSEPVSPYRRWISIGLGFSLLGDILLAWPQDLFVFGLGAFLFAHLAYLKAYLVDCRRPAVPALILALLAGGSLLSVMASQGLGDLLVPVSVYALAISAMLWRPRPPGQQRDQAFGLAGRGRRPGICGLGQPDWHRPLCAAVRRRALPDHPQLLAGPMGYRRLDVRPGQTLNGLSDRPRIPAPTWLKCRPF